MRVRAFIHIHEDESQAIEKDGYYTVEAISKHTGMREQVIADITRRMATLASELKMWNLTAEEQAAVFARLRDAMQGEPDSRLEKKSA